MSSGAPEDGSWSTVFVVCIEAGPGCSKVWVWQESWSSKVLSTGVSVRDCPRVIFIGADDQDRRNESLPVKGLLVAFGIKKVVDSQSPEEEEVIHCEESEFCVVVCIFGD